MRGYFPSPPGVENLARSKALAKERISEGPAYLFRRHLPMSRRLIATTVCLLILVASCAAASWYSEVFRKVHLDYHLNPWIRDAAAAVTLEEARRQMRMMKEAGVEAVEFFAYDHFGHAFYPSKIVRPHPSLRNDYYGNMRQAAREEGLRAITYVNVFGGVHLFTEHPDWYVVDKTGKNYPAASWLPQDRSLICASSPYVEKVLKPLLTEIITRYAPDAIWMDGGNWLVERHCYCRNCKEKFRAFAGEDIPDHPSEKEGEEAWRKWMRWKLWRRSQIYKFLTGVTRHIHSLRPEILVTDNNVGRYITGVAVVEKGKLVRWADPKEVGMDFLSCDPVPYAGNHAVILSREGRYQSTLALPFDFHSERFQGWGEWHLRETTDFKIECSTILANGGRCFIADQPWPDGTLEAAVYQRVKETYEFIKPREAPYRNAQVVSEIGVLAAETTTTFAADLRPLAPAGSRTDAVNGAHLALVQEGFPFQIFSEANLKSALAKLKLVVVPEQVMLLEETMAAVRSFVESGGRLLVTGQSGFLNYDGSRRDTSLVERLLGVRIKGTRRAPVNYLELTPALQTKFNLPQLPMMVRGPMFAFEAEGAEPLAHTLEPRDDVWDEKGQWRHYTVRGAMPPSRTPAGPAAVLLNVGKGKILYVAGNWFTTYRREGNPTVRKMLAAFISTLLPREEQALIVEKPLRVEATLMRNEKGYLVSLVNSAIQKQSSESVHAEEVEPATNIKVRLRAPETVRAVRLLPEGTSLDFKRSGDKVDFTVQRLEIQAAVQVETR